VRHQQPDGAFARSADRGGVAEEYDTAFAILFLTKGHIPALLGKLCWSDRESDWNFNLYDLDNLARWTGPRLNGRPVGWQTVSFADPVQEWLKSPILLISGHAPPPFNAAQKAKLRKYMEEGGTVLADAGCSSKGFADAMRKLAAELFPDAPLSPLAEDHPIYRSFEKLPQHWPLEGLSFGCRTNFILSSADLSCAWEMIDRPDSLPGLKMGLNIAAYATARLPLPERLTPVTLLETLPKIDTERMGLFIGKLRSHDADWNSRPFAADRLLELVRTQAGVRAAGRPVPVDATDERLFQIPVLYLSGHRDPAFTDQEKQGLKRYLERGGFLLAEACCGQKAFDQSFRALMAELFPEIPLETIPANSPLYNGAVGQRIDQVSYSSLVAEEQPNLRTPRLDGLKLADRYAVLYSPYALAPGLDGIQPYHARGYAPEDARRIALNVVLYALKF